jgi:hypothetical protein
MSGHTSIEADGAFREALYWSRRGEIACAIHTPAPGSPRWSDEGWAEVPVDALSRHAIRYQCQDCAESRTPIVHRRLNGLATGEGSRESR